MNVADFKEWMQNQGKKPVDVASLAKVSLRTVERFLDEQPVRPVVLAAFERLTKEDPQGSGLPPEPDQAA